MHDGIYFVASTTDMTTEKDFEIVEEAVQLREENRFESYLDGQRERLQRVCDVVDSVHHEGDRIVEAGAEPYLLQLLLDHTLEGDVIGLDLDPGRYSDFISSNSINVKKCNMEYEDFPIDNADVAVLSEVFEHLHHPLTVLKKLRVLLEPDGYLVLTTPNLYRLETWVRFLSGRGFDDAYRQWEKQAEIGHMGHVRLYTRNQVQEFLKKTGFDVLGSHYERFGASDRHVPIGPILSGVYQTIPPIRPYQLHVAQVSKTECSIQE